MWQILFEFHWSYVSIQLAFLGYTCVHGNSFFVYFVFVKAKIQSLLNRYGRKHGNCSKTEPKTEEAIVVEENAGIKDVSNIPLMQFKGRENIISASCECKRAKWK